MTPAQSKEPNRAVTRVIAFLLLGLILFSWGCKKESVEAQTESLTEKSQKVTATQREQTHAIILQRAKVTYVPYSSTPPELKVNIECCSDETNRVIAYKDLRIEEASTESQILRLLTSYNMKQMVHGVFMRHEPILSKIENASGSGIPLYFEFPRRERLIKRLKGSVTVVSADKTETQTIKNIRDFISDPSRQADLGLDIVKGSSYPSEFVTGLEAYALTFRRGVLANNAKLIDRDQNELTERSPSQEVLPDGRCRILINHHLTPLENSVSLRFDLHTDLQEENVHFDLNHLQVPEIDESVLELVDEKIVSQPFPANTQRGIDLQATAVRNFAMSETANGKWESVPYLEIQVEGFGAELVETIAVGKLNVEKAVAGAQSLITTQDEHGLFANLSQRLQMYTPDDYYVFPPIEGVMVSFPFEFPTSSTKTIELFSGKLTVVTAAAYEYVFIDNIMDSIGKPLHHPHLEKTGLDIIPEIFGDGVNITLKPQDAFKVSEMTAIDPSGGDSTTIYSGHQHFDERIVFSFHAQEDLPEKLPVRIRINHGLKELRVPFEFKDLPIPHKTESEIN